MKIKAFVGPDFVADTKKSVRSVRLPDNVYHELEKVSKILNYESVSNLQSDILFGFLVGHLIRIDQIPDLSANSGKIQALESENMKLKSVNTQLEEQISLYKAEIEQYARHIPHVNAVNEKSVNAPQLGVNAVNAPVNADVYTPFTERIQTPFTGVNTPNLENVNTFENTVNAGTETQMSDEDGNLKKIQELETEIDQILLEKDDTQNKLEKQVEMATCHEVALNRTFTYLCTEIKREYKIDIKESSLHELFQHFINQYHEENATSID